MRIIRHSDLILQKRVWYIHACPYGYISRIPCVNAAAPVQSFSAISAGKWPAARSYRSAHRRTCGAVPGAAAQGWRRGLTGDARTRPRGARNGTEARLLECAYPLALDSDAL